MERKEVRILVVDDEPLMADSLKQNLVEEGYTVDTAGNGAQAVELFDGSGHHLVVCDLQLPDRDMNGMDVLRHIKETRPSTEVIMMTGYGTYERAVEAIKAGAYSFLPKPFDFEVLLPQVEKALERRDLLDQTSMMRQRLAQRTEYFNIIGSSKEMQTIYETIESVAKSDANVLIVGESGTGKELIANA
ncbi:MAG TPA: response regulator, partial [Pyrinomonadaceae bacterium]